MYRIKYWVQETLEYGRWELTPTMPYENAKKIIHLFKRPKIVPDAEIGEKMSHAIEIKSLINRLQVYNDWRRGADIEQPQPTQLGKDIDKAIELLGSIKLCGSDESS